MKVEVRKFGEILTSRPAGREAGLTIKAYFKPEPGDLIELDFSGVLAMGPSWLDEVLTVLRNEYGTERVVCIPSENASVTESLRIIEKQRGRE
ncbi:MAG: STAS-like domain-containing protein [Elusimicrobia bacterium]|nr:STAS-like domain-containing protein [Candidatus Obscuribacterium magneticum]